MNISMAFLPSLIVLVASPAFALNGFAGHWIATQGSVTGPISSTCSRVEVVISQTSTEITTEKFHADCTSFTSDWGSFKEIIKNDQVFDEDGDAIGTINNTELRSSIPDTGVSGIMYTYNLTLENGASGKPMLKIDYGTSDDAGGLMVEATLAKVSP